MVLAEPVMRSDGLTLAGPGLELTESIIERIQAAGADTVTVEGHPLEGDDEQGNLQALADGLGRTFRRHKDNAFMMTLHNMLAEYFAGAIAARKAREEAARKRAEAAAKAAAEAAAKAAAQSAEAGGEGSRSA